MDQQIFNNISQYHNSKKIESAVLEFAYEDRHGKSITFRCDGGKTKKEEEKPHEISLAVVSSTFRDTHGVTPKKIVDFRAVVMRISC